MLRILFLALVTYLAIVVVIYVGQRTLQYAPNRNYPGTPAEHGLQGMQALTVKTEDGLQLVAWFAPPKNKNGKVVVLYHGNAGNIADRKHKALHLMQHGYGVYLAEYRGFGGNGGRINETGLYHDARSALQWLSANGYPAAQWVIYGESIGSGPAVQMALEFQPKALILEGAFSSAVDVAKGIYWWLPVNYLLKDRYDNISKISEVKSALLMIHGENDGVVPIQSGKKLFDAANHPKEFVTIQGGGHNDLYNFGAGAVITDWLKKQK